MTINDLNRSLSSLLSELVFGAPAAGAFILNRGDPGLLASLDHLSASEASASRDGGGSIAAHTDHLRYGLSLMNRWSAGENPFQDANWAASWELSDLSEGEWKALRQELRTEVEQWHSALQEPRDITGMELDGVIGSVMHVAYHLGAMRQINATLRGPKDNE